MKKIKKEHLQYLKNKNRDSKTQEQVVVDIIKSTSNISCFPEEISLQKGFLYLKKLSPLKRSEIKLKKQKIINEIKEQGFILHDII